MIEAGLSAFIVGLLGAGHCIGMCGGIASALGLALSDRTTCPRAYLLFGYNLGRILSYALAGSVMGWLASSFSEGGDFPVLRVLAGLMMILLGFYLAGWWRLLAHLERVGATLWRFVKPLADRLLPVSSVWQACLLGGLWGWLPCGLIYSALVLAMAQASAVGGALTMFAFGLGTLPAMLLSGVLAHKLGTFLRWRPWRWFNGVLLMLFGLWTITIALQHSGHNSASQMDPGGASQHEHHHH